VRGVERELDRGDRRRVGVDPLFGGDLGDASREHRDAGVMIERVAGLAHAATNRAPLPKSRTT